MKRPDHLLRYAIYARVSTADQNCEMQLRDLRAYRTSRGGTLVGEYVDTGWSGSKKDRPNLNRLLADVAAGKIDVVLVWKIDRFGRNLKNFIDHIQILKQHEVRFIATTQNIDTADETGMGHFFLMLLALIAELERNLIKERSLAGRMRRMTDEQPDSWQLPLGFGVKNGFPVIVDKEAEIVRQVFEMRELGKSVYFIANALWDQGYRTKRSGGRFQPSVLTKMLGQRSYISEYKRCGKVWPVKDRDGNLLRIISDERFLRVQREMAAVKRSTQGRSSEQYLLAGWVYCHKCGSRCHGVRTKNSQRVGWEGLYYRCSRNANQDRAALYCKGCYFNARVTEELVWREVWALLCEPERLRKNAIARVAEDEKTNGKRRDPRKALKAARDEQARILEMVQRDMITMDEAERRLKPVKARVLELEDEARLAGKVVEIAPLDAVERICAKIRGGQPPKKFENRRSILEMLINLRVTKTAVDGEIEISGEVPMVEEAALAAYSGKKNCTHHLAGSNSSFDPLPFKIAVKVA